VPSAGRHLENDLLFQTRDEHRFVAILLVAETEFVACATAPRPHTSGAYARGQAMRDGQKQSDRLTNRQGVVSTAGELCDGLQSHNAGRDWEELSLLFRHTDSL
jgi:hypothetical protein